MSAFKENQFCSLVCSYAAATLLSFLAFPANISAADSISLKGDVSDSGEIAYGEAGTVTITVSNPAPQYRGRVHIMLARQGKEGEWVDMPCRVFATKYQDCACNGRSEELKFDAFSQVKLRNCPAD